MNFLLISKPGHGKTTSACTCIHPTLLIDIDGKAAEMQNIKGKVERGDIVIKTFRTKLVEDKLKDRALHPDKAPSKQPEGYVEIVDYLNDIIDGGEEFKQFNTIVLDSLTRLIEHMKRLLIYHRGKGKFGKKNIEGDMNWPSWGSYLSNLEELFYAMQNYMEGFHFICTAHLKKDIERNPIDQTEVIRGYYPLVDGQMREKLAGYFNEVYYMDVRHYSSKPSEYRFRTKGTKYDTRTSLPLDEFEPANITKILQKGGIVD